MSRKSYIYAKQRREAIAGSLATMNLITMFWLTCRDSGIPVPDLRNAVGGAQRVHGRNKRDPV